MIDEGAKPQPGVWPEVTNPTKENEMLASSGNGKPMRESFLKRGLARYKSDQILQPRSSKD